MENYLDQDIALVYGDQMIDFIKNRNPEDPLNYIKIGNVRLEYYKKNKLFFDEIIKKEILNYFDPNKKTILYAPTWEDGEKSSSFFEINENILLDILLDYNLIIKLHPRLYDHYPGRIINFIEKYKNFKNLKVLYEFPIVYPLLEITDIYLGDYSSVGYDFLKFNRPMFFIDKHNLEKIDKKKFLHNYGINIEMKNLGNIKRIILDGLEMEKEFKKKREELYFYAFDKNITNENIIKNLNERCLENSSY
jgi:CDP-glycerol glycerophosphotransferase (TagB/SpsB family)